MVEGSTAGILKPGQQVQADLPKDGVSSEAPSLLLAAHPWGQGPVMGQGSPTHPHVPGPGSCDAPNLATAHPCLSAGGC